MPGFVPLAVCPHPTKTHPDACRDTAACRGTARWPSQTAGRIAIEKSVKADGCNGAYRGNFGHWERMVRPSLLQRGWRTSELFLSRTNDDGFLLGLELAWMRAPAERRVSQIKRRSSLGEIQSRRVSHRMLPAWVQAIYRKRQPARSLVSLQGSR